MNTYGVNRGASASGMVSSDNPLNASGGQIVNSLNADWTGAGWSNPLFWLTIFILLFLGYLTFGWNFGVKRVADVNMAFGRKARS